MLGNGRSRNRGSGPPTIAQHESGDTDRKRNARSQDRAGDASYRCRTGLTGVFAFRGCTAAVCLRLTDGVLGCGTRGVVLVHRARTTLGAARHPSFRRRGPACADSGVAAKQHQAERNRRKTMDEPHHHSRMLDPWLRVKPPRRATHNREVTQRCRVTFAAGPLPVRLWRRRSGVDVTSERLLLSDRTDRVGSTRCPRSSWPRTPFPSGRRTLYSTGSRVSFSCAPPSAPQCQGCSRLHRQGQFACGPCSPLEGVRLK